MAKKMIKGGEGHLGGPALQCVDGRDLPPTIRGGVELNWEWVCGKDGNIGKNIY